MNANANADAAPDCPGDSGATYSDNEVDGTNAVECGLVGELVETSDIVLEIPVPGDSVGFTQLYDHDAEATLVVSVDQNGIINAEENPTGDGGPGPGSLGPCEDTTYNLNGPKWYSTTNWWINKGTIPTPNLDVDNTVTSLRDAIQNITNADNDCGMTDDVSAAGSYQGDTNKTSLVGYDSFGNGTCGPKADTDGQSTVHFGDRPPKVLASTCWYTSPHDGRNQLVQADIEIDNSDRKWTTIGGSSNCDSEYDLESIITHEFGHFFGLGHTYTSIALTMYKYVPSKCTTAWRTLGRGDVLALEQLY